ncbi:MAG TPA: ABC transporter ATP-binding protein [Lichenihabitans sp.]|jgi:ABC-type Fe3+/spermidine/putrescine transport system ATPase subunit|nr:ABC transporter ATP-binding protein [Lichenihabitans sp.]
MARSASIEIRDLTKRYGPATVVDKVSLSVAQGEFLTLLGLSGSGKSTTLMAVAGFVDPDGGSIAIAGRDVTDVPPEKRDLGVVFQSYALFPHLNVVDNIAFPLRMRRHGAAHIRSEVGRVLDLVSLQDLGQRRVGELSGGQQQRVALARALVFAPQVLLMDEPLGALDRQLREQLQVEIKRLHRQLGVTVLYVTHDQEEALSLSDRIAIMADGRVQQLGTPADVYMRPETRFVAGFFGESNFLAGVVECAGDETILRPDGLPEVQVRAGARPQVRTGRAVVMVRPEAIEVGGAPDPSVENHLAGTVDWCDFLGASIRLTVRTGAGPITVRKSRLASSLELAPGAPVWLNWRAHETTVFGSSSALPPGPSGPDLPA